MLPVDPELNWWKIAILSIFAGVGGALGYILRSVDAKQVVKPVQVLLEGLASMFFAVIIGMLLLVEFKLSSGWVFAIVGVTAWLGARTTVKALEPLIFRKLGVGAPTEERQNDQTDIK